jgi:hypothetical protein
MIRTATNNYFTIWSVNEKDGKYTGRASTSRKDSRNGSYINSNWNVRFVKDAAEKAKTLNERDRIVVAPGDMSIENVMLQADGDRKATSYLCVTIFNFDFQDGKKPEAEKKQADDDELPF